MWLFINMVECNYVFTCSLYVVDCELLLCFTEHYSDKCTVVYCILSCFVHNCCHMS